MSTKRRRNGTFSKKEKIRQSIAYQNRETCMNLAFGQSCSGPNHALLTVRDLQSKVEALSLRVEELHNDQQSSYACIDHLKLALNEKESLLKSNLAELSECRNSKQIAEDALTTANMRLQALLKLIDGGEHVELSADQSAFTSVVERLQMVMVGVDMWFEFADL